MSRLTAAAYYAGIPPNNSNIEKPLILDNFLEGVRKSGDIAIDHRTMSLVDCDVALIQGFVHDDGKQLPHLMLRKNAVDKQKRDKKRSLIVDSNLFLYANIGNTKRYLRYSFDGVFPTTGFYFDTDIDDSRWSKISRNLNISLKPWRTNGNHILICLQRHGGWSMRGLSTLEWLDSTIKTIRTHSQRHIIVRAHPNDKKIKTILKISYPNVSLSQKSNIKEDLKSAWATILYNSSPSVASAIEGIPVFLTDPYPQHSQSFEIANTDLSLIENPKIFERDLWIKRLSMCHWNFEELKSGEAWQFFKRYA